MARPTRSLVMARRSAAALLAAIEVANKPTGRYQEETFCLLLHNAWEILLKARVVQQNNNKIESIYDKGDGRFRRDLETDMEHTLVFTEVLGKSVSNKNIRNNLLGINAMKNEVAHMGLLPEEFRRNIRAFGSASVHNFCNLFQDWFGQSLDVPYLLPIAFVGATDISAVKARNVKQRSLLKYLSELAESSNVNDVTYAVRLRVDIPINPLAGGGGTIGVTSDPNAPRVQLSDTEIAEQYPMTYRDLVSQCRGRYRNFTADGQFLELMRMLKQDLTIAYHRKLDPKNPKSPAQWRYKQETILAVLDSKYIQR